MKTNAGTRVKGASLLARLDFITETGGHQLEDQVLACLEPPHRESVRQGFLPSKLYPLSLNEAIDKAIASVVGPADPVQVFRELGRYSANKNLQSFHSIFLRGEGPHDVLSGFPSVRRTYYSDGKATYTRTGETRGVMRVNGAQGHTLADCESTAGYFERACELVGGSGVQIVLTSCRSRGDSDCEFACSWR